LKISREDVLKVARLAHLELTDAEAETYRAQLDSILEYMGKLNELDVAGVEPMAQVSGTSGDTGDSRLRDDTPAPCNIGGEVLAQAPDARPPFFRVPRVIER